MDALPLVFLRQPFRPARGVGRGGGQCQSQRHRDRKYHGSQRRREAHGRFQPGNCPRVFLPERRSAHPRQRRHGGDHSKHAQVQPETFFAGDGAGHMHVGRGLVPLHIQTRQAGEMHSVAGYQKGLVGRQRGGGNESVHVPDRSPQFL